MQPPQHGMNIRPENVMRGGERFIPGETIPGNGAEEFVDGAETAGAFEGVADSNFLGKDGLGFADLLDVINPLQHLPVIGNLYRAITGDQISAPARLAGGTIFGGPIGFVSSLVNTVVEEATGADIGGNLLALFNPGEAAPNAVGDAVGGTVGGAVQTASATAGATAGAAAAIKAGAQLAGTGPTPLLGAAVPALPALVPGLFPQAAVPGTISSAVSYMPKAAADVNQGVPDLSPAAFQALMSSVNNTGGTAKPRFAARHGLTAGSDLPPVSKGTIRDVGMEIHNLLRPRNK